MGLDRSRLEYFSQIGEDALRAVKAEAIIQGDISVGKFIQLNTNACTPTGGDGFKAIRDGFRVGLGVDKHHSAEEPVARYTIPVFGFQVDHVFPPEPAADITPAHIGIGV